MPLWGTRGIDDLEETAPVMDRLDTEPMLAERVEILQVLCEIGTEPMEDLLPPALHPTIPPTVTWIFYSCAASPVGGFRMAQTRIGCRAGVRPRGYLMSAVIDNPEAGDALACRWGYTFNAGDVRLERRYDRVTGRVTRGGLPILEVALVDPEPIPGSDVFYTANMNPARTPAGLRLVQVDPEFAFHRAERGRPEVARFDAEAWGDGRVTPVFPVSASAAVADVSFPRLRYVCRLDVPVLQGTQKVG